MGNKLFSRYSVPGTVLLQPTEGKPRTVKGELVDLSLQGLSVYSGEPLGKETVFRFLLLSKDYNIRLGGSAKVVYAQPVVRASLHMFRLGLDFLNVDSEQLRDIILRLSETVEPKKDTSV